MFKCLASRLAPLAAVFAMTVATGCSAPAMVEGIVAAQDYVIQDNNPALRLIGGEMAVVLNEEDGDQLRVVALEIPDLDAITLGEAVPFAEGEDDEHAPTVSVSQGDLVVIERSDGARIVSSENNTFYEVVDGSVTLHDRDEMLNGEFTVELEDGGHLIGSFSIPRQ